MQNIAIVTDSNSGITQKQGEEMGIYVVPMPFFIDDTMFLEDITLDQKKFYEIDKLFDLFLYYIDLKA